MAEAAGSLTQLSPNVLVLGNGHFRSRLRASSVTIGIHRSAFHIVAPRDIGISRFAKNTGWIGVGRHPWCTPAPLSSELEVRVVNGNDKILPEGIVFSIFTCGEKTTGPYC